MNRTSIWSISLLMTMTLIMMISCSGSDGGSEGGSGSNGDGWYAKGFITSFPITISAYGDSRDYVKAHVDELFLDNGRYGGIISFPGDNTVTHGPAYQHDEIEAVHLTNNGVLEYYEGYLYKCGSSGTMGKTLLYKVTGSPLGDVGFYASSPECFNYTREGNVIKVTINNVTKTFTVASDGALVIEGEKYYKFNFGQTYVDNSGSDDDKEDAEVIAAAQSVSKTAEVVGNPTFHTAVFKCTFGYSSQEGRYNKVFAFSKNRSDLENSNDLARRYYGLNNNITHPNSYSSSLNSVNGTDMSNGYREDGDLRFANENTADLNKIYVEYDDLNVTIYYCPVIMFASKAFPGEIKSLNLRQLKQTSGFVDLGLSCLWSATNNKASTPWDLGSSTTLLNANVSGGGRLPTKDEVLELNKCKLEVIDNGVLVTGSNGNEIFIPFRNTNGYSIYNYGTGSTQKSGSNTYDVLFEYDGSTRKFTTKKSTSSINIGSHTMHTDAYVRPVKDGSGGGGGSSFYVSTTSCSFTSDGGTQDVSITSDVTWKATCNAEWITLTNSEGNGNGTLKVKAEPNPSESLRSATISINYGSNSTTLYVMQDGYTINLDAEYKSWNFSSNGGTLYLSITCNTSWKATCSSNWVTLTNAEGNGNGTLIINATPNTSEDEKSATVVIKASSKSISVNLKQYGIQKNLNVSPNQLDFGRHGGSLSVSVTSDTDWNVNSNASWITLSKSYGNGNDEITITTSDNPGNARSGTVIFTHNNLKATVKISQEAKLNIPFEIEDVVIMNTDYNGNIINMERDGFYASTVQYLSDRIKFKVKTYGSYRMIKKWYLPGSSEPHSTITWYNLNLSSYYDYSYYFDFTPNWYVGEWKPGNYKWEYYYEDELIYTKTFTVH